MNHSKIDKVLKMKHLKKLMFDVKKIKKKIENSIVCIIKRMESTRSNVVIKKMCI